MLSLKWFFFLLFPLYAMTLSPSEYAEIYAKCIFYQRAQEGLPILEKWEMEFPQDSSHIKGLKSVLFLLEGELFKSWDLMEEALEELEEKGFPSHAVDLISYFYTQILEQSSEFSLCKNHDRYQQPKGVKLKYWIGVAGIAGGLLIFPFNPAVGGALMGFGGGVFLDATSTALDNKDNWERSLDERQRVNPDNLPRNPPNTLPPPPRRSSLREKKGGRELPLMT